MNWLNDQLGTTLIIISMFFWFFVLMGRQTMKNNPEIGDAAKKAATAKAINIITRLLK